MGLVSAVKVVRDDGLKIEDEWAWGKRVCWDCGTIVEIEDNLKMFLLSSLFLGCSCNVRTSEKRVSVFRVSTFATRLSAPICPSRSCIG